MYQLFRQRWLYAVVAAVLAVGFIAPVPAGAGNGDPVHQTNFAAPCVSGAGVGIAFDGRHLWYSCLANTPDLFQADPKTGAIVASYNVASGLGALAWDGKRRKIWAGWGQAGVQGDVRLFDPATGTAEVVFNAAEAGAVSDTDLGLAYDARDDTLLINPTSTTIYRYSASGASLGSFAWHGTGCLNSGVAIGGQLMFEASLGCGHVWVVDRDTFVPKFDFDTDTGIGAVFDADLECDSVTFAPRTVLWSVQTYEPRRATAFEIPAGSCATGGGVDSDGDALLDEWEINGATFDPDGIGPALPQFVDLPAMGADADKPDIFLEIDWMATASHSHAVPAAAIKKVVDAFAASPYVSPTGSVGINLHVDAGPDSVLNYATNITWGTLARGNQLAEVTPLGTDGPNGYDWSAFDAIKADHFTPSGRGPVFHYVIAAHAYGSIGSSGLSRGISASDMIISLGTFLGGGSENDQAGTLMHELGHNLGLRHGGRDDINRKPNYLSVMSYNFQNGGLTKNRVSGIFDYSREALPTLDENNLSEPTGVGPPGYTTKRWCPDPRNSYVGFSTGYSADWNCNGSYTETGVTFDVNNDGARTTLTGFNDWANIKFRGGGIGAAGAPPDLPTTTEQDTFTVEEAQKNLQFDLTGFYGPVDNPPTVNAANAGSAIPAKFSLGGDRGLNVLSPGSPFTQQIACDGGAPIDDIEQTTGPGQSTLTYDAATDQYTYVWKTSKSWAGTCRQLTVHVIDGTELTALFTFK